MGPVRNTFHGKYHKYVMKEKMKYWQNAHPWAICPIFKVLRFESIGCSYDIHLYPLYVHMPVEGAIYLMSLD